MANGLYSLFKEDLLNKLLDLNTDTIGQIEVKWLYTEFPMFLVRGHKPGAPPRSSN